MLVEVALAEFDPLKMVQCLLVDDTGEEPEVVGQTKLELWELMPDQI